MVLLCVGWLIQKNKRLKALYEKISKQLIFNAILRVIIQSYLVFLLANAVISNEPQDTLTDSFLYIGSIVCLVLGALFPLAMAVFLNLKAAKINAIKNTSFKDKFSSLYDNLDTSRHGYVRVPVIYFIRRYLMVIAIVYLKNYPVLQVLSMSLMSLAYLMTLYVIRPFQTNALNTIEKVNETCFIMISYCNWVLIEADVGRQYKVGWTMIMLMGCLLMLNLALAVVSSFLKFKNMMKSLINYVKHKCKR